MQLLERETHLQELHQALSDAAHGRGRTALIAGEAGIGKTALVEQFTQEAAATARVLWGACEALFTPRPLGPFHDMVNSLGGPLLARLEANFQPVDLFHGLLDAIRKHDQPTMLVLEDLHWADHATLDFIRFIARRIDKVPGLLILTFRDDEVGTSHPLTAVLGEVPAAGRLRLKLPVLSRATVGDLARRAGREGDDVYRVTGGNPFFVAEVLHEPDAKIAPGVREAVLSRAQRLSSAARELLELVSVVPDRLEVALLRHALGSDLTELEECLQRGLLDVGEAHVFFRHELARLAIEDSLSPFKRAQLNAKILEALARRAEADPATLTRLAHHAIGAAAHESIARYAPRAAAAATSRGAHREAVALLDAAAPHLAHLPSAERATVLEQQAEAFFLMGQIDDALAASRAAQVIWQELGNGLAEGRNLARRCYILVWGRIVGPGDIARVAREAIAALERVDAKADQQGALVDQMALGHAALAFGLGIEDKEGAARSLAAAMAHIQRSASPRGRIMALVLVTFAEYQSLGAPRHETVEALKREAEAEHDDFGVLSAYVREAWAHYRDWNLTALEHVIATGGAFAIDRQLEDSNHSLVMRRVGASALAARGHWDEATARYASMAAVTRLPWVVRIVYCEAHIALLAARRGQPYALSWLDDARQRHAELYLFDLYELHRILLEIAWLARDDQRAHASLQIIEAIACDWTHPWALGEAALWNLILGREAPCGNDLPKPYALQFAGDARAASQVWRERGYPYEAAVALMLGDEEAQRESVRALEHFGAHGTANRVRERMRAHGLRGIPQGPRSTTRSNAGGLTEREVQILGLLDQGLSNAQMARRLRRSVRTVEHHVAALLGKLGAQSRQAAVARARERGLLDR